MSENFERNDSYPNVCRGTFTVSSTQVWVCPKLANCQTHRAWRRPRALLIVHRQVLPTFGRMEYSNLSYSGKTVEVHSDATVVALLGF